MCQSLFFCHGSDFQVDGELVCDGIRQIDSWNNDPGHGPLPADGNGTTLFEQPQECDDRNQREEGVYHIHGME